MCGHVLFRATRDTRKGGGGGRGQRGTTNTLPEVHAPPSPRAYCLRSPRFLVGCSSPFMWLAEQTPRGASRFVRTMYAWSVKARRNPPWHYGRGSLWPYGLRSCMKLGTPPPPPPPLLPPIRSLFPMGAMPPQNPAGFPNAPGGGVGIGDGAAEGRKATPDLSLSTLEFYLFSFAWVSGTEVEVEVEVPGSRALTI